MRRFIFSFICCVAIGCGSDDQPGNNSSSNNQSNNQTSGSNNGTTTTNNQTTSTTGTTGTMGFEDECKQDDIEDGIERADNWDYTTHCKDAPANPDLLFGADVLTLTIEMVASDYDAMEADLADLMENSGGGGFPPGWVEACEGLNEQQPCTVGGSDGQCIDDGQGTIFCFPDDDPFQKQIDACNGLGENDVCSVDGVEGFCVDIGGAFACFQENGPGPSQEPPCAGLPIGDACTHDGLDGVCVANDTNSDFVSCAIRAIGPARNESSVPDASAAPFWDRKPLYFSARILMGDSTWENVGIRYKGNNGLASSEAPKRPFRLEADQLEDDFPLIRNQRFHGYKELSFASNQTDPTFLHQHAAASTFRTMGVAAPHTRPTFVVLKLDDGRTIDLGLYTMTEIPGKQFLREHFDEDDGNLYKPDGRGAHFRTFVEASFHRKSNKDDVDFSDVQNFIAAVMSTMPADQWRTALESTFDMQAFIKFAAVNQAIGNWDTYGGFAHNYYLYANEDTAKLTFIPWDFDLSFDGTGSSDLSLLSFTGDWPLYQAIVHEPVYAFLYHQELSNAYDMLFANDQLAGSVAGWGTSIANDAENPAEIEPMQSHISSQKNAIRQYLDSRGIE